MKKVVKTAGLFVVSIIISKFFSYIYRFVIARLGPQQYGVLSLGLAIIGILGVLASLGLNNGVIRYISFYKEKKQWNKAKGVIYGAIFLSFLSSTLLGIILFIFANKFALLLFKDLTYVYVLRILAIGIPFIVITRLFIDMNKSFQNASPEIWARNIGENGIKVVLSLVLVLLLKTGLYGASLAYTIAVGIAFVITFFFFRKYVLHHIKDAKRDLTTKEIKQLLDFSWPLFLLDVTSLIILWTDTIMIGFFKSAAEVGIYNAALPIAQLLYILPYAFSYLSLPIFMEHYAKEESKTFIPIYKTINKWIFLTNVYVFLVLIFFSKEILVFLFGEAYVGAQSSLIMLSFFLFLANVTINCREVLLLFKKTKFIFMVSAIAAVLNVILNLLMIPRYGVFGAAIATSTSFLVLSSLQMWKSKVLLKTWPFTKGIIKITLYGILAFIPVVMLNQVFSTGFLIVDLLIFGAISVGIYALLIFFGKVLDEQDRNMLNQVKTKLLFKRKQ